jgi:GDPmannose 4,6-dehydratase
LPTALITGAAGQDGLHLLRYLGELAYDVVAMVQFGSAPERERIRQISDDARVVTGDVTDLSSLLTIMGKFRPDEVYNLAAISSVGLAWDQPLRTAEVNGLGLVNILEAVRATGLADHTRVFQASSAQIFGEATDEWFTEESPIRPVSPYGVSKAFAHATADSYRRRYGMFISCGILGNHESSLHDEEFVVRRITRGISRIATGEEEHLSLFNLTATRDWGYAGDFVRAMHASLAFSLPEDFVIATGELHSVGDVVAAAAAAAGITDWQERVRTTDNDTARAQRGAKGDISKARRLLDWQPRVGFEELISAMVKDELTGSPFTSSLGRAP